MSWTDEPPPFDKMPPGKWDTRPPDLGGFAGPPRLGVLGDAWRAFTARAGTWIVAMIIILVAYGLVYRLASWIVGPAFELSIRRGLRVIEPGMRKGLLYGAAAAVINGCLAGGLMRMGIRQWRKQPYGPLDCLGIADVLGPLVRVSLLYTAACAVGFFLCFVPGLILAAVFMFAIPLVLDGERSALQAMTASAGLLRGQWVAATIVHTVLGFVLTVGGSLCLVGLVVAGPLYVLSITRLYTERTGPPPVKEAGPGEGVSYL